MRPAGAAGRTSAAVAGAVRPCPAGQSRRGAGRGRSGAAEEPAAATRCHGVRPAATARPGGPRHRASGRPVVRRGARLPGRGDLPGDPAYRPTRVPGPSRLPGRAGVPGRPGSSGRAGLPSGAGVPDRRRLPSRLPGRAGPVTGTAEPATGPSRVPAEPTYRAGPADVPPSQPAAAPPGPVALRAAGQRLPAGAARRWSPATRCWTTGYRPETHQAAATAPAGAGRARHGAASAPPVTPPPRRRPAPSLPGPAVAPTGRDHELERATGVLRRDLGTPRVLAFANPKGGVHKTTATVLAAATVGSVRGRGVLAWDDNELRGTLGLRAGSARHARTIRHLVTTSRRSRSWRARRCCARSTTTCGTPPTARTTCWPARRARASPSGWTSSPSSGCWSCCGAPTRWSAWTPATTWRARTGAPSCRPPTSSW